MDSGRAESRDRRFAWRRSLCERYLATRGATKGETIRSSCSRARRPANARIVDGRIVAAAQEERFTRVKHDHRFPRHAIDYCLSEGGLKPEDIDHVVFYEKPFLKFERLLETYLAVAPAGFPSFLMAMPLWVHEKLRLPSQMSRGLDHRYTKRYVFLEHHESHAASAFFPSPFEEAAILTLDGVGEWATATLGHGRGNKIELSHEMRFPHS